MVGQVGQQRRQLRRQVLAARGQNSMSGDAVNTEEGSTPSSPASSLPFDDSSMPGSFAPSTPTSPTHPPAHVNMGEVSHSVAVALRALGHLNQHGLLGPLLSHSTLLQTLDDACVLCMPCFGGKALEAVVGGLARTGHRPSRSLLYAVMRRVEEVLSAEVQWEGLGPDRSGRRSVAGRGVEAVHPSDQLCQWQLVSILQGMASMRCSANEEWVVKMLGAWRMMARGVGRDGVDQENREFNVLLQVARVYNVRIPVHRELTSV